jgi:hypothetical protein
MATSRIGATCIIPGTDPKAKARLSGQNLAKTMMELCGAVELRAPKKDNSAKPSNPKNM